MSLPEGMRCVGLAGCGAVAMLGDVETGDLPRSKQAGDLSEADLF